MSAKIAKPPHPAHRLRIAGPPLNPNQFHRATVSDWAQLPVESRRVRARRSQEPRSPQRGRCSRGQWLLHRSRLARGRVARWREVLRHQLCRAGTTSTGLTASFNGRSIDPRISQKDLRHEHILGRLKSWHRGTVIRAAQLVAEPIGRASTRGRPLVRARCDFASIRSRSPQNRAHTFTKTTSRELARGKLSNWIACVMAFGAKAFAAAEGRCCRIVAWPLSRPQ